MDNLYDTHFHLDLHESKIDIIKEIDENKIYTIAVTNLPPLYEKLKSEIKSEYIRVALGFHPELIGQYKKYIPDMWKFLPEAKYIGEVGLDFKVDKDYRKQQIIFFEELIKKCNILGGKILSVHSRSAVPEIISIIGKDFNGEIILHWYSGTKQNLNQAILNGYYFSINYSMLNSISGCDIIKSIPNDRLLIETDSPFTSIKGHIFKPKDIPDIVRQLGVIKGMKTEEIKSLLWSNFKSLLNS